MNLRNLLTATALAGVMATAASAQTLVYCSEGSPEGFDPALYTSGTTFDASSHPVFNRLVEFKVGTTEVIPGLAESYDVSEDGDKEHPWYSAEGGSWEYFDYMGMPDLIEKIVKVDDYTVKFVLKRPEAPFIANMAMDFASVMSKEYADQLMAAGTPELMNQQPVGTGPFEFVAYQKDAVIRYAANPDYWKEGLPKVDNLVFAITTDNSVRYQKLLAGECHVMPYPNPADVASMKENPAVKVMEQEGLNVGYMGYNTQMPPFDNPAVRRALNSAIDKQAILEVVFQGSGNVAKNPIPPTMWGYNDAVQDDVYDPEAARAALEAAGVTDLSMKIWAMPVQRPYNPNARRMAELI